MRKVLVIAGFLKDKNREEIRRACEENGFDVSFYRNGKEAEGKTEDAEVLYCSYAPVLGQMPALKWCHSSNAGVSDYLASGLFDSGDVILTNSSGSYGRAISEHIIMTTLMLMRQMPEYLSITAERGWAHSLPIRSIAGSRIAIAGTGDLGSTAAEKFRGLGAWSITGFNRSGRAADAFDEVYSISAMDEHLADLDVLVMCMPETAETIGLLDAGRIGRLPDSAYVINVGRGSAIDQDALISALNEGRLAGAALDVVCPEPLLADHPLWTARNCIITPHIAGDMGLPYTIDRTVEIFCSNLRRYAAGDELINRVDANTGY